MARGCADGIDYNEQLEGTPLTREAPAMGEANGHDREAAPKKRGRPRKVAATGTHGSPELDEDAAKLAAMGADPGPTSSMFEDALPTPPGMPE
jgi:hypothetical protein